jgi:Domain of unknown function (DUF4262)
MDTSEHYCRCQLCDADEAGLGADTYMESIRDHIARVGWAVPAVYGDDQGPSWAYSVGIWHTHRGPELAMFGCPVDNMAGIINGLGRQIAEGVQIAPGDMVEGLCPYPLAIRPVHQSWRMTSMFAVSDSFYGYVRPPFLQIVWPDRRCRFPCERGFERRFEGHQPLLWLPRDDHPPGVWSRIDRADA